ncbi:MAG: UDP-N-acetylmuramoyl-L-alanyl-D-glutamate--2,6-diaminopimelate ligase, partial [Actinomycetia bacterium]|nr:UDP-N-acetylmuramoyl-L-alanyl-D-glutamate--2,6-diaminopimelate ligase [Actinomycetes bacterium]
MKIAELASAMDIEKPVDDINIKDIVYDSRQTRPGSLFVAIPGTQVDGHKFIDQALDKGAVAAVVERARPDLAGSLAQIEVPNARKALAQVSDIFFGQPSRKLRLVGVTGTNGKTTIAYLMESIFKHAGFKTGLIGTIEYKIDN